MGVDVDAGEPVDT